MQRLCGLLIATVLWFSAVPLIMAEEELFDSKTATEHLEKGLSHLKARNYGSAVTELEESITYSPNAEAYYYLGYAYYLVGRSGDAESRKKSIECFDKCYELNPGFRPTRYKTEETTLPAIQKEAITSAGSSSATTQDLSSTTTSTNRQ